MTKRRRLSTRDLVALFSREAGVCHLCKLAIAPGQQWDVSHDRPLELGGADDETNWKVAHRKCHREHTSAVDIPAIAKAKRSEAAHIGARRRPKQPIAGNPDGLKGRERVHAGRSPAIGLSEIQRRYLGGEA